MKLLNIAFVSLLLTLPFGMSAEASQLDEIIARKKLIVAVPQDFPPFGSVGPDLKPEGYDIDVAKLIAKDMGVEIELVPVSSANRIPFLQTGKVDLVISTLGANPDRAKVIWFSSAYAPFFSGVFASKSVSIKSYDDLKGKTLGVTRGNLEDLEISKRAPKEANIKRFEDNATTTAAYLAGQVDVLISGNTLAAKIIKDLPEKQVETKMILKNSPTFIGMKKGDVDLLHWLNVFILHKKLGGELDEMSMKWFGTPVGDLPTL